MKVFLGTTLALTLCLAMPGMPAAASHAAPQLNPASRSAISHVDIRAKLLRLAQATHAEICKANLDQCETGCDGFAQCIKQCEINYQGCMDQGG